VFEIDQRVEHGAKLDTSTTMLYGNGAWRSEVRDRYGTLARTSEGCVAAELIGDLLANLRDARWQTSAGDPACHTDDKRFTVYTWHARRVFTARRCGDKLDRDSRHVLDQVEYQAHVPALDDARMDCTNPLARGCH